VCSTSTACGRRATRRLASNGPRSCSRAARHRCGALVERYGVVSAAASTPRLPHRSGISELDRRSAVDVVARDPHTAAERTHASGDLRRVALARGVAAATSTIVQSRGCDATASRDHVAHTRAGALRRWAGAARSDHRLAYDGFASGRAQRMSTGRHRFARARRWGPARDRLPLLVASTSSAARSVAHLARSSFSVHSTRPAASGPTSPGRSRCCTTSGSLICSRR